MGTGVLLFFCLAGTPVVVSTIMDCPLVVGR